MRKQLFALCLGLFYTQTVTAVDLVLVEYTFAGATLNPTTVDSSVNASIISAGSGAAVNVASVAIPSTMNYNTTVVSTSSAAAITNNSFFQFTVTPNSGATFSNLSFEVGKGGSSSPRGYDLRSSLDSYATTISTAEVTQVATPASPTFQTFSVPLTGSQYLNVSSPVTFRIYGYTPTTSATLTYNRITLSSTSVPEPSTVILSLAGIATLAWTSWRRTGRS